MYGWPPSQGRAGRRTPRRRTGSGYASCGCYSSGSSSKTGPIPRPATQSSAETPEEAETAAEVPGDRDTARLITTARASADLCDRLVAELLARTGMRAGELADLEADAVMRIGAGHWLRIPLGTLATTVTCRCSLN